MAQAKHAFDVDEFSDLDLGGEEDSGPRLAKDEDRNHDVEASGPDGIPPEAHETPIAPEPISKASPSQPDAPMPAVAPHAPSDPERYDLNKIIKAAAVVNDEHARRQASPEDIERHSIEELVGRLGGLEAIPHSEARSIIEVRLREFLSGLHVPEDVDDDVRDALYLDALETLLSFNPQSPSERMIASQMVTAHHLALMCAQRAVDPDNSPEVLVKNINNVAKMMSITDRLNTSLERSQARHTPPKTGDAPPEYATRRHAMALLYMLRDTARHADDILNTPS